MAEPDVEPLEDSTLFLAVTRPAMVLGVPMEAMGANVILTGVCQLLLGLQFLLLGILFHILFMGIARHDHKAFSVLARWFETKGRSVNTGFWGGFSITPAPLVQRFTERDLHG